MRFVWIGFGVFVAAGAMTLHLFAHEATVATDSTTHPTPVLVELFTSEGCSSCPPADALLARLDANQFVPGARAIVLSEHVTYWNSLGWSDPFSFEKMTERQQTYVHRLGLDSSYTPQAVVDGVAEFVGSDERKMTRAVAQAAVIPKHPLAIEQASLSAGVVHFTLRGGAIPATTIVAALAEDAAQSSVLRGENGGRTLRHVAVVRSMEEIVGAAGGHEFSIKQTAASGSALRLVVFAVERRTGHVVALDERLVDR